MPTEYVRPLDALIRELSRLPGIGPKSAQRLALYLIRRPAEETMRLADVLREACSQVRLCTRCFHLADSELCPICQNERRDQHTVCVVSDPRDVIAIERTGEYKGTYHVLHGVISPMDGIAPDQLRIRELLQRLQHEDVHEVILALNPTLEGDTTALYIARMLKPAGLRVTQLAQGMPSGGDLDYADQATLASALEWRREI